MTWLAACKEYAASVGKWTVPKKDSEEYKAIKAIQARMASAAAPASTPAPKAGKKPKLVISEEAAVVPEKVPIAKAPRVRKEKAPASDAVLEASKADAAKKAAKTAAANAKDAEIAAGKAEAAKARKARKADPPATTERPVDPTKAEQPAGVSGSKPRAKASRIVKETTVTFD